MKEKTKLFKMIATLVCVMIVLTMFSTYSFASVADDATTTITINKLEQGINLTAYQITTANFHDNQFAEPQFEWVGPIKTWLESHETYKIYASDIEKFDKDMQDNAANTKAFYSALTAAIKSGDITGLTTKETNASGTLGYGGYPEKDEELTATAQFTDLEMGSYLIFVNGGYRVYEPVIVNAYPQVSGGDYTLPAPSADVKSSTPTISKTVNGAHKDSVSTKDVINYEITADVPTYLPNTTAKAYYISDKLDSGLVLNEDSIKVYGKSGTETLLTKDTHYTLTTDNAQRPVADANQDVTFSINFNYDQISQYDQIIVRYEAGLDTTVQPGTGYSNKAFLDYNNDPYVDTSFNTQETGTDGDTDPDKEPDPDRPDEDVTVYTYGMEVTKVDKANTQTKLPGAEFALSIKDSGTKLKFTKTADGTYYLSNDGVENMVVGADGVLRIYGLDEEIYTLEETKAPNGYNLASEKKDITIADKNLDGVLDSDTNGVTEFEFTNSQGFQLPVTGGIGTTIFVACGIVFLGIGIGLMFVAIKKRNVK